MKRRDQRRVGDESELIASTGNKQKKESRVRNENSMKKER